MNDSFVSGGLTLRSYLARPAEDDRRHPGVILCHGFPIGPLDARQSALTFPQLMDRVASELSWNALTFTFRGCGSSEGDFSMQGWVDDLRAAIDHLDAATSPNGIWLVGTNTGGALALCVAADDPRVRGCALLGPRADFDDWAAQPRRFLEHAREIGAIRRPAFPQSFDEWSRELRRFRPLEAARRFAPRPLLVMHGEDDESVPVADSRQLAEAHGAAELRVVTGAGHRLRHDPRAIAVLLGWLDRQRPARSD
ncbi:MAG: alpha/beta hydrolase family protein [Ilumatobacteraceae bacterium]